MKKYMYLIIGLMLLSAGACQKTGETPTPPHCHPDRR